jgi:hypothetical protein
MTIKKGKTISKIKKNNNLKKEKVKTYYEAESWQFSGCGD